MAKPGPLRFTLINALSLPAVLVLPYAGVLLFLTNGMTSSDALSKALVVFEIFLYTSPFLLAGWTIWLYRRLKRFHGKGQFSWVNRGILFLPYAILLIIAGYLGGKEAYQWYQHQQILETRNAKAYPLPDTLAENHLITHVSLQKQLVWLRMDTNLKDGRNAGKSICRLQFTWNGGPQKVDTQLFEGRQLKGYSLNKKAIFRKALPLSAWKPQKQGCLVWGKQRAEPVFSGLSRYGGSDSEDQFEAYRAGDGGAIPVLPGIAPFDYELLDGLITDKAGRHWFLLRKGKTLLAGFLKPGVQDKLYRLKGAYDLPDDPQKPTLEGLAVHDGKLWFHGKQTLYRFPL